MKDYRDVMPNVPVIEGWTTTNYRDLSRNYEVQRMQGFVGVNYRGEPVAAYRRGWNSKGLPEDEVVDYIGVPEGQFHSDTDHWPLPREAAIEYALDHVHRLNDEANRILTSVRAATREDA